MVLQRTVWALMSWWAIVAAVWLCAAVCSRRLAPGCAVSKGVFCAYILHQTVIVLLTQALRPVALPWGWKPRSLLLLTLRPLCWPTWGCAGVPLVRVVGVTALNSLGLPRHRQLLFAVTLERDDHVVLVHALYR